MSLIVRYPRPAAFAHLGPGHHVVASSAGTGKTFLLEHLFVDLVLHRGVPAEEILVVTFTEKAVAELILRVRRLLEGLVGLKSDDPRAVAAATSPAEETWTIDEQARTRLQEVIQSFDRLSIFTIHGFCRRVLREHAFAQSRLLDEELIDEESAFTSALRDTLRTGIAKDGKLASGIRAWIGLGESIGSLEKLLLACDQAEAAEILPRFDEADIASATAAWPGLDDDDLGRRLRAAKLHAATIKAVLGRLRRVSDLVRANRGDVLGLLAAMQVFPDEPKMEGGLAYVVQKLESAAADARIAALRASVQKLGQALVPVEAALAHMLLPSVQALANRRKRQAGQFDYSDMLRLVAETLASATPAGSSLLASLRRRYRYALIDEFQDTDAIQWSIFRRIFVEADHGHALTVIGDPKQSIYRFRGADVHTYLEACQVLLGAGGRSLVLDRNFRSSARMVEATNLVFAKPAGFFRAESGIAYDRPVICSRDDLDLVDQAGQPQPPVLLLAPAAEADTLKADQARSAVRAAIVAELRRILDKRSPLLLREHGRERPLGERDIFILTFSNRESRDMGRALGRAAIPFAFYKLGELFDSPEAADVLDLLRAIAAPEDRNLRGHALLTPFFALDLVEAAAAFDLGADARPVRLLFDFAALAEAGDIPGLFSAIVERTGIIRREVFARRGERSLTNVLHLFEILQGEWARSHRLLPELVDLFDALVRGTRRLPEREGDLQRLETDKNAVQILTVHKAKGLEANVVFLYGGTGEHPKQAAHVLHQHGRRVLHVGRLGDAEKRLADGEEADERSRLLYVACTRARVRLVLPHYPPAFKTLRGPYRQMNQRLDQILAQGDAQANPLFHTVAVPFPAEDFAPAVAAQPAPHPDRVQALARLASPAPPADVVAIRERRSGFLVTSYTAVKQAHGGFIPLDSHADAKAKTEAGQDPGDAGDGLPSGAATGIFLHEILASVSLADLLQAPSFEDWFALPQVRDLFARLCRRYDRRESELPAAARLVHTAYTAPLRLPFGRIERLASVAPTLREMEFLFPIPESTHPLWAAPGRAADAPAWRIGRGVVKGFVDLLFEHQGKIFVCDWKSDVLDTFAAGALARHCRQNYDVQARIYTTAALRMCGIGDPADHARRFGGVIFSFLRGRHANDDLAGIHFERPTWEEILSWESEMLGARFWGMAP